MITALLLNPCIDRTVFINGFLYGEMNRIVEVENIPSGKGTNVALALHKLGGKSGLVMFGQKGEDPIKKRLDSYGIPCEKVDVFENIRVNTKLNNTEDNVVTEINEKGAKVTEDQIEEIIKLSIETAKKSEYFVLTGSMPQGCDSSLYGEMMAKIKATAPDCKLVLDAEGENFRKALNQKPFLIKPNKYELEMHCGRKLESIEEIANEGMKLHKDGVEYVIISMGAEGAIICSKEGSFYAKTPKVTVVNTVGAGDSMLAASILALSENNDPETVIKYAVAAGCSAVSCTHSELISKDIFEDLKSKVETKRIQL
jgi:1-phosphofructokinase